MALLFADESAGKSIAARIAMMAMTTSSSMSVKAVLEWARIFISYLVAKADWT
jgi:hypothetical protein